MFKHIIILSGFVALYSCLNQEGDDSSVYYAGGLIYFQNYAVF